MLKVSQRAHGKWPSGEGSRRRRVQWTPPARGRTAQKGKRTRAPEEQCRRSFERSPRVLVAAAPPRPYTGGSADSGPQRTGICSATLRQEPVDRRLQAGPCKAGGLPPTRTQNSLGPWAEPRPLPRPQTPGMTSARPAGDLHGGPKPTAHACFGTAAARTRGTGRSKPTRRKPSPSCSSMRCTAISGTRLYVLVAAC